jgi:uncharacterized protein YbaR (Trm112 family)
MNLDPTLMAIIVCPDCHGSLEPVGEELVCQQCGLAYPVRDDIPVLLVDEARRPAGRQADDMATWFDESRLDDEAALAETDRPLSELLADYQRYCLSGEINSEVADQVATSATVEAAYADVDGAQVDHLDGLTVTTDEWWFNVRPSNTEPLLRLNVEGADEATMTRVRDDVLALIRSPA